MRHAPRLAANLHTSSNTLKSMVVPVGLDGDVIITALVLLVQYWLHRSAVRWKRVAAEVGTSMTRPSKERTSSRLHG